MCMTNNFGSATIVPYDHKAIVLFLLMCLHNLLKNKCYACFFTIYCCSFSDYNFLKNIRKKLSLQIKSFREVKGITINGHVDTQVEKLAG